MSGQFSPRNGTGNPLGNDRGSSTRVLLLVLLLVVAAAGYLYFFTDYIMPRKGPVSLPPQPVQVKQPIPPRPGQTETTTPGQVPPAAPPSAAPPVQPAPVPVQAKGQPGQKPAPAPSPAKPEPAKPVQAVTPAKPAAPAAGAPKPTAPVAAPAAPKPVVATAAPAGKQVPAPAKTGERDGKQAVKKVGKQAVKKKGGPFRLLVGDFGPDKSLTSVQTKLKKCGILPVRKSAVTAAETMNRIFVAQFNDQDSAEAELRKLKKITGDAFLIADNGGYSLYAGSYLDAGRTAAEQKKLGSRGVKSVIKKAKVTVRVTRVTAGSYASSEDARKDAARLKKQGVRATVIRMK